MSADGFDLTPEERAVFAMGFEAGEEHERTYAREVAFGAIRRAVEVARWHERNAWDGVGAARGIRSAIRAATGSPKA